MPRKRRTLILIRRGERETLRLSRRRLALLAGGLACVLVVVALVGGLSAAQKSGQAQIERLRLENATLRGANEGFETRLGELQARLVESEDRTRKLAIVAGLGQLAPSEAGVGGPLQGGGAEDAGLAALEQRSGRLARELDRVEGRLQDNLAQLSATPAIWPVTGLLTSGFGWRLDPLTGQRAHHTGVDISAPPGRPVASAAAGVVVKTEQFGGLGRAVYVSHGFGRTTVYGHLSRVLVSPGQRVDRGATLGLVGNTGRATGYHLHYEVQLEGDAVNPLPYLLDPPRVGS